jgi:hypothetical protein
MRRHLLALTVVAAAVAPALPASATTPIGGLPYCATALVNGGNGSAVNCPTLGPPPLGNRNVGVYRTMRVAVATGSAAATLSCDGTTLGPYDVTPTTPLETGGWGGQVCNARVVATTDGTTAVVTSTYSYVINLD